MKKIILSLLIVGMPFAVGAQSLLYPQMFDYNEVTIGQGVFKQAEELNYKTLLEYDTNCLLTPFFRQAGMSDWEQKYPNFRNWGEGTFRLDGHVGGHYVSALALAYASCRDNETKNALKSRMDYMVNCMDSCQRVFDNNSEGLYGYIGGLPDNKVWTDMYRGDINRFKKNGGNVPFYVLHKIIAGLRDAYVYGGNEKAKKCFLKMCDWSCNVIKNLDDKQLQTVLGWEHGGMNEPLADAYRLTKDVKYLEGALRFSHTAMLEGMQHEDDKFLDNKHANTQVPKYIGFQRIAQEERANKDVSGLSTLASRHTAADYHRAAMNFWNDVVYHRTLALGGNSINEHFLPKDRCSQYITSINGPESCNTNNMLKLSEDLFADSHEAKYADFYEEAMINHVLSTQNPKTGGYVYFTSLRPQHYRVYSQVNSAMWCCVGTGMENHSKYGEFVFTHVNSDSLFINLFVDATLDSKMFKVKQQTEFPFDETSTITIDKPGRFVLGIRHPNWCKQGYDIMVNGKIVDKDSKAGQYAYINRKWKKGDKITVTMPMQLTMEACPNLNDYIALKYGPVLLSAKTGTDNMPGLIADDSRMGHVAGGLMKDLTTAPILIGDRSSVLDSIYCIDKKHLTFKIKAGLYNSPQWANLTLEPFFNVHEARYMIYWQQLSQQRWSEIKKEMAEREQQEQLLQSRTIDYVATGEQQSDAGHSRNGQFNTGNYQGEYFISCEKGERFEYTLSTNGEYQNVSLMCRYTAADNYRVSTIYVDGIKIADVLPKPSNNNDFYNVEYAIPSTTLKGKQSVKVTFVASGNTPLRSVYYLRLLKK